MSKVSMLPLTLCVSAFLCFMALGHAKTFTELNAELAAIKPLDPGIAAQLCKLKSGTQEQEMIQLIGTPTMRKGTGSPLLLEWKTPKWKVDANFDKGIIILAGANAPNRPEPENYNFRKDPTWKMGRTTLPEVESRWGKGTLVGVIFYAGRTSTLNAKHKSSLSEKLLVDKCVKFYAFSIKGRKKPIKMSFVNNIYNF